MNKIFSFFLFFLGSFSSVLAFSDAEDSSPQALTKRYLAVVGHRDSIPAIKTAKEGFDYIVHQLNTSLRRKPHSNVESGPQYGFSFVHKNKPPVAFVTDLMTGKKSWKKEDILYKAISIADIGCGLGFSAAYFISETVKAYSSEPGWNFQSPIKLDLYDITPAHQDALRPLAALVNAAYPEYFHVETFTHDAKDPLAKEKYRIVFALNLLHYVPEPTWPHVVRNIEDTLEKKGMFFVTTDHYHGYTCTDQQCQRLEMAAKERAENPALSPFVSSLVSLMNPEHGEQFQTNVLNSCFNLFLKNPTMYVPGERKSAEEIDLEVVKSILRRSAKEYLKPRESIGLYDGKKLAETPIEEIIQRLKDGSLAISLANYGFDDRLLEKAILTNSRGMLVRLKISSWPKELLKTTDGYPSSVGLTFTKRDREEVPLDVQTNSSQKTN